jgi:cytochrome P450
MTETVEVPAFPMTRGCPFDPPAELATLRRDQPASRVRLSNGSTPWLVTRYADVREVLLDPRVSADSRPPGRSRSATSRTCRMTGRRCPGRSWPARYELHGKSSPYQRSMETNHDVV